MNKREKIFYIVIVLLVIFLILSAFFNSKNSNQEAKDGIYDEFAICLKDSGAVFYGAFWCSHCNENKELFGSSKELLPYVECSNSAGTGQLDICKEKNIEGYPTWEFADGSRISGLASLEMLRDKTNCVLPELLDK